MKWAERTLRRVPSSAEFDLYGRVAEFPAERARERLGYHPEFPMGLGIEKSVQWLLHEGVVAGRGG
jgi:hypothetical protein